MLIPTVALLIAVVIIMAIQSGMIGRFIAEMLAFNRPDQADESLPKAAVVLALRGSDPFLTETLKALLRQDYPHFEIHIVLDGPFEEAQAVIESATVQSNAEKVVVEPLRDKSEQCTLKCSALRQAVSGLLGQCEVIAFVDSDVVPHRLWLRDLVRPLADPAVGAATGNRWYLPREANWGSLVRRHWNAGALVQMWLNGMVWGGSMALRSDVIEKIDLLSAWSRALSVDCTVSREIRRHGYRVQFVPGAVAVNTEQIRLADFLVWVKRQLVAARTSRRNWAVVLLHALLLTGVQLTGVGFAITAMVTANPGAAALAVTALLGFWLFNFGAVIVLERAVRRVVRCNGQELRWPPRPWLGKRFAALLLTLTVYPYVLFRATFCRRVSWRGIEYEVMAPDRIHMVAYRPLESSSASDSAASVV